MAFPTLSEILVAVKALIKSYNENSAEIASENIELSNDEFMGYTKNGIMYKVKSKILRLKLGTGSPADVYATYADLVADDPNKDYIYLVTADGNWYYWDIGLSSWESGGIYQDSAAFNDLAGSGRTDETVKDNADNVSTLIERTARVYGLDYDEVADTYARTDDAIGLTFGTPDGVHPIASDFNDHYPWKGIRNVKVDNDHNILAYEGDATYASADGEYMSLLPQFWFKRWREGDIKKVRISDMPLKGYYEIFPGESYHLIGRFPASYDGELHSKPDMPIEVNRTYTSFIQTAQAKGDGKWSLYDAQNMFALELLLTIETFDNDMKAKIGVGINSEMPYGSSGYDIKTATTSLNTVDVADSLPFYVGMLVQIGTAYSNNSIAQNRKITNIVDNGDGTQTLTVDGASFSVDVGDTCVTWGQPVPVVQADALGEGSGYYLQWESQNRSHVCYRGIWDLWGNVWQFTYGFARYDGEYFACFDRGSYDLTDPRTDDNWFSLGVGEYIDNGYQKERGEYVSDRGSLSYPTVTGGGAGSGTFYAAYLVSFSSLYTGVKILPSSGGWYNGSVVSLFFCAGSGSPSTSDRSFGTRLISGGK